MPSSFDFYFCVICNGRIKKIIKPRNLLRSIAQGFVTSILYSLGSEHSLNQSSQDHDLAKDNN